MQGLPEMPAAAPAAECGRASRAAARRLDASQRRTPRPAITGNPSHRAANRHLRVQWAPGTALVDVHHISPVARPLSGDSVFANRTNAANTPNTTPRQKITSVSGVVAVPLVPSAPNKVAEKKTNLFALSEQLLEKAVRAESAAGEQAAPKTLAAQLGALLHRRRGELDLKALVAEWDRAGDGTVEKADLRIHVRKLGLVAETVAIDQLHKEWCDVSKHRAPTVKEVRTHLKSLQEAAACLSQRIATARDTAARLRQRAEQAKKAAEAHELADDAERKLAAMHEATPDADALAQAKTCALLRKSFNMQQQALRKLLALDDAIEDESAPKPQETTEGISPSKCKPTARRIF